jgi:iron complex outermembrane receptor protein
LLLCLLPRLGEAETVAVEAADDPEGLVWTGVLDPDEYALLEEEIGDVETQTITNSTDQDGEAKAYESVVRGSSLDDETPQVQRIDRDRVERSPASSIAGILEHEAGIIASTGRRGERHFIIRGFDQRQVAVVIDDVPAYLPYDGDLDLGKLPSSLVEDVVVLRPPGSLRYGPSGMGGTISIRTRQPGEGPLMSARFVGGRGRHLRFDSVHSYRLGRLSWLVGGGIESQTGYHLSHRFQPTANENGGLRDQSDRRLAHGMGRFRFDLSSGGFVETTVWHVGGQWGIPRSTVVTPSRYWRVSDYSTTLVTVVHRWRPTTRLVVQETAFVGLFDDLLDAFDDDTYSTQNRIDSFHSWYHDRTAGGRLRLRWTLAQGSLLRFDLGGRYEDHRQDQLLGNGTMAPPADHARALISLSTQFESWLSPCLRLVAALQSEVETGFAEATQPSGDAMISVRYQPVGGRFAAGLSVARRSRLPTLKERFSATSSGNSGGRLANPELGPESALHLGLDATVRPVQWLRLEATAFESEVYGLIELSPVGTDTDQFHNVDRARQAGVEVAAALMPTDWLDVEMAYNYLYARELNATDEPTPLSYRPEQLARLAVRVRPIRTVELESRVRLVGPQDFQDPISHNWRRLGAYLVWDARLGAKVWQGVSAWLQVTNMLDGSHQTQYGYPEPGWQLWSGLRLELPNQ